MFFPFIGSVFYLYHHFYSQRSIENLSEGIKTTFVGNYKIDKLEKELKFSETVSKKIELANEHSDVGNYERALELYTSCCIGIYEDDPDLIKKIVKNSFLIQDYGAAIEYGRKIENEISFKNSDERVAYAWSLFNTNNFDAAAENFRSMDVRFSNYKHRLQFAKFLYQTNQKAESLDKLQLLLEEIDSMDNFEKKSKKTIQKEIQNYLNAIK